MNDEARDRLVSNVVGHLKNGVTETCAKKSFRILEKYRPGDW